MELKTYFDDFLKNIRPTDDQVEDYKTGHKTLRERLRTDDTLSKIIVSTFLQGSYRRSTAVRPHCGKRPDVDVVVVTRLSREEYPDPEDAMTVFIPFLDRYYKGKWQLQGRSYGIELSFVDLDLVITSAPSESEYGILKSDSVTSDDTVEDTKDWRLNESWVALEKRAGLGALMRLKAAESLPEWQTAPLYIPDRDAQCWQPTDPLAQIHWTWDKNAACNGHYVNVVKALKWWRRINHPEPKYPKGYPVEHLIGVCCPDRISSVADGVVKTLEKIAQEYRWHAMLKQPPILPDHGVPQHNVFARVSGEDFSAFHAQVVDAAAAARRAYDAEKASESAREWQKLFGSNFPDAPEEEDGSDERSKGRYTAREQASTMSPGRFA